MVRKQKLLGRIDEASNLVKGVGGVQEAYRNRCHIINGQSVSGQNVNNNSAYNLLKIEKSLLCIGLNFAIPPDKLEISDYLLSFELLYREIKDLDLPNEKTSFLKAKMRDSALSSLIYIMMKAVLL